MSDNKGFLEVTLPDEEDFLQDCVVSDFRVPRSVIVSGVELGKREDELRTFLLGEVRLNSRSTVCSDSRLNSPYSSIFLDKVRVVNDWA